MTLRIKTNRSSMFRGDMGYRLYETGADETQEHLEVCTDLSHEQRGLNMDEEKGKLIFWRRIIHETKLHYVWLCQTNIL